MTEREIKELVSTIARRVAQEVVSETVNQVVRVSVKEAVSEAAKEIMENTFLALGLDIKEPLEIQKDMQTMRSWRKAKEKVAYHGLTVSFGIVVAAILSMVWAKITEGRP